MKIEYKGIICKIKVECLNCSIFNKKATSAYLCGVEYCEETKNDDFCPESILPENIRDNIVLKYSEKIKQESKREVANETISLFKKIFGNNYE